MGKRFGQAHFKRRQINEQEKVLEIDIQQKKCKLKWQWDIATRSLEELKLKTSQYQTVSGGVRGLVHCWWGCKWHSHFGKRLEVSYEVKHPPTH